MRGVCVLALLAAVVGIIHADIFSGFLGCRFSQSVCQSNEECVDDHLFGTCQRLDQPRDRYQYLLSSIQLHQLERVIANLITSGYTWDELYTQCVLSNILLSFRQHRSYDADFCDNGGMTEDLADEPGDSTIDLLKAVLEDYYRANEKQPSDYPDYNIYDDPFPVQKKDEVVQVHKYLKSHKRVPLVGREYQDVDGEYSDVAPVSKDYYSPDPDLDPDVQDYLQDLSPEKLQLLEEYLGPLTGGDEDVPDGDVSEVGDYTDKSYDDTLQSVPTDDDYAVLASIDVQDATLLDQLLQGKVSVSDLGDEQISHLSKYVDKILKPLRKYGVTKDDDAMEATGDLLVPSLKEPPVEATEEDVIPSAAIKKELFDNDVLKSASDSDMDMVKKIHPNDPHPPSTTTQEQLGIVDLDQAYIKVKPPIHSNMDDAAVILVILGRHLGLDPKSFTDIFVGDDEITFRVNPNAQHLNASEVARLTKGLDREEIKNQSNFDIYDAGVGQYGSEIPVEDKRPKYFVLTFVLCGVILGIVLSVIAIYIVRRHLQSREKLAQLAGAADGLEASNDYQDLCRQRMQSKSSEKPEPLHISRVGSVSASESAVRSPSSRSSTSSRSEEPVVSNMDISTGHIVLSYMEDHMRNKDRLDQEWDALCVYEAEPNCTSIASDQANMRKNKYSDVVPYDHSRVILTSATNVSGSDYINASTITDHDPRNPAYICTQGPLPHTVADFWQMVWEQGSVVIVNLTKLTENGQTMCHRYWPEEGSDLYHIYEVHLVSEHIWCDEYLVRCFYLKNLQTNETRTVSQFHFVAWPDLAIPSSAKALLDFRRKVNKSYRGQNCPIVVHCSDGSGRSGCYCLLDMVLNRMSKGAKEIDIAATLEHIRDQRMLAVKTKEQFEFVLSSVAEEVQAILKALQ